MISYLAQEQNTQVEICQFCILMVKVKKKKKRCKKVMGKDFNETKTAQGWIFKHASVNAVVIK